MRMRRWDFTAAYLQGALLEGEVVYCLPPPGYTADGRIGKDNRVCKVVKPIYGMTQAGRRWQRSLFPWLEEIGFKATESDSCVFQKTETRATPSGPREEKVVIGCYVDDLQVLYKEDDDDSLYRSFTTALQERWQVEDEGDLTDLLGVEFQFGDGWVKLHQAAYIDRMTNSFFPDGPPKHSSRSKVPCDPTLPQLISDAQTQDPADIDPELVRQYQQIVGSLLYAATNTRPDISYSVGMLSRAMARPTPMLLICALRVLEYLHHSRELGLRYAAKATHKSPVASDELFGMSDSDWAVKHSTTGWLFMLSQATVSWGSKKQVSVALSSCEAEIMAASDAAKEALYLRRFAAELGMTDDPSRSTALFVDNMSAIDVAYNPEHHGKVKHIERRHFFIREAVEDMKIRVPFVATADNWADFFTKALPTKQFVALRNQLMNVPIEDTGIPASAGMGGC